MLCDKARHIRASLYFKDEHRCKKNIASDISNQLQ